MIENPIKVLQVVTLIKTQQLIMLTRCIYFYYSYFTLQVLHVCVTLVIFVSLLGQLEQKPSLNLQRLCTSGTNGYKNEEKITLKKNFPEGVNQAFVFDVGM